MFWYEDEVKRLEKERAAFNHEPGLIFYGSSSIRFWPDINNDFGEYDPVNLGFGGSTLAACVWFFSRIIAPIQKADRMIIYAGDNDLGDGRHPEEVFIFFKQLVALIREHFGEIPIGFISIKPSINRWNIVDRIRYTNKIIQAEIKKTDSNLSFINIYDKMIDNTGYPDKNLFVQPEGLHINTKGYGIWKKIILNYLQTNQLKPANKIIQPQF